jgi:hypothetical protein
MDIPSMKIKNKKILSFMNIFHYLKSFTSEMSLEKYFKTQEMYVKFGL